MKTIKLILISIVLVLSGATSAQAMGDREQGALLGAGAIILLGNLLSSGQQTTRYVEAPVYYNTQPTVVYTQPYYPSYTPPRVVVIEEPHYRHPSHHYRDYRRYDDRYFYGHR